MNDTAPGGPMRPEDMLADSQDELVIDGVQVRKGTLGAVIANARRLEALAPDDPARAVIERELQAMAPAVRVLGLLEVFEPRSQALKRLLDAAE